MLLPREHAAGTPVRPDVGAHCRCAASRSRLCFPPLRISAPALTRSCCRSVCRAVYHRPDRFAIPFRSVLPSPVPPRPRSALLCLALCPPRAFPAPTSLYTLGKAQNRIGRFIRITNNLTAGATRAMMRRGRGAAHTTHNKQTSESIKTIQRQDSNFPGFRCEPAAQQQPAAARQEHAEL